MPKAPTTASRIENRRWQQANHDQRRELITDTALRMLRNKGLESVTMRAIAEGLGIGAMTLYTYVKGKNGLHREMAHRGFKMLNRCCIEKSTWGTEEGCRGEVRAYLRFAMDNPKLYNLMFEHFMADDDEDLLKGGFQHLFDKVEERLPCDTHQDDELDRAARASAGRFWIALHGLATLAIAGRLIVLEGGLDELLDDLIEHVAPELG